MPPRHCHGAFARLVQYDEPEWEPLLAAVGERLTEGFMWMCEVELDGGLRVHSYKHRMTRRYIHLDADARAFEHVACDRYVPQRLDFAIEAALCTWWVFGESTPEDRDAVVDAIERASDRDAEAM